MSAIKCLITNFCYYCFLVIINAFYTYVLFIIPFLLISLIILCCFISEKFKVAFTKTSKISYLILPFVVWFSINLIIVILLVIPKGWINGFVEPVGLGLMSGVMLLLNIIFNMFIDRKHTNKVFIALTGVMALLLSLLMPDLGGK